VNADASQMLEPVACLPSETSSTVAEDIPVVDILSLAVALEEIPPSTPSVLPHNASRNILPIITALDFDAMDTAVSLNDLDLFAELNEMRSMAFYEM
jgi:hypothetical protein